MFQSDKRMRRERSLRYESLEDRRVLSATGFESVDSVEPDAAMVATENYEAAAVATQSQGITRLLVEVNGNQIEVTPANPILQLAEGDSIEVIDIEFTSTAKTGVFAAEGYVSKISDFTNASTVDYNDGRFSVRELNQQATGGEGAIEGLNEGWTVENGWDRLTINLMHYTESSTEVADQFLVNLQVGEPDFEFDTVTLDQIQEQSILVGDSVTIPAKWVNNLDGTFHNYAEVDIYHSSNMDEIVWAGASVGNVSSDNPINGEFLNTQSDDPFSEKWTPQLEGEYVLKYYLDPEAAVSEANEDNNEYEIRVNVAFELAPEAVDDHFDSGRGKLNVLTNDLPVNSKDQLQIAEFSQAENGTVKLNKDGTFKYSPNKGFSGVDHFEYVATDGNQLTNAAVVTIDSGKHHSGKHHKAEELGPKDKKIKHDSPKNDKLEKVGEASLTGKPNAVNPDANGVHLVSNHNHVGPETTPLAKSDVSFQLVVTPASDQPLETDNERTVDQNVKSGGEETVEHFQAHAENTAQVPMTSFFTNLGGSAGHGVTFDGLQKFMKFSDPGQNGSIWNLTGDIVNDPENSFDWVEDTRDWHKGFNAPTPFENSSRLELAEAEGIESMLSAGSFTFFAFQQN